MKKIITIIVSTFLLVGCFQKKVDLLDNVKGFNFHPSTTTDQVVNHKYYSLSYSEEDEQAEWIVYKITSNNFDNDISRTNDFREDPKIKTGSAKLSDYKGSGYDRGHLVPAGSMKINKTSMSESFYTSNMSPQLPGFNRGIWKRLEEKVRYWAAINDSIFVATGPILDKPLGTIGTNNVTIPRAYYKTLLGYKDGKAKGLAFILPHERSDSSLYKYIVSINDVEEITGIDFYHKIDKAVQAEVESNIDVKLWFLKKK